jgi:DNA-binding NtrC family response regulator
VAQLLLIEDDPTILRVVGEILSDAGHAVTPTSGGVAALQSIDAGFRPDLVVLDMRMPDIDGWELRRQLDDRGLDLPLFVMTAARDAAASATDVRAVGHIAKPFDIDEFVLAVAGALDHRSAR